MLRSDTRTYSFLLYLLAFLLFWEWLKPLTVITDTTNIDYFIGFAAFSFFLSYLRFPIWITSPAKFIALIYALHMLFFYNTSFFNGLWIEFFLDDFKKNMIFLFDGNWVGLTNLFRSLLFFILLWIVSYLMHYWLIQTRKLFLFFFVTVIYLTILDTFTMYHANGAIVRTMIIGLILLGILRVLNIQDRERVVFEKGRLPVHWVLALAIMIAMTSVVGYAAPKIGPQWPDPVPFITKATNGYSDKPGNGTGSGTGTAQQTIGYDSDDTKLGGSFAMDNTPIFSTIGKHSHYWRVASKDIYTGKGWVTDSKDTVSLDYNNLSSYPALNLYEKDTQVEKVTDRVHYLGAAFPQLIYGGTLLSVKSDQMDGLQFDKETGELQPMNQGQQVTLKDYDVNYLYPVFSLPKLKKVTGGDPAEIKAQYLQLPKELPERVKNLAESITKDATNRYDKASAIVNYFMSEDFQYVTTDVPVPGNGQDYVDQFLFDTKRGYCDNFSTSMAVMLRTIGIPARWVKGFTQGEYNSTKGKEQYEFVVKNSDAHSWVEVYFPDSGWVPFEPTKGFNSIVQFNYSDTPNTKSETTPPPVKKNDKKPKPQQKDANQVNNNSSWLDNINLKFLYKTLYIVLVLFIIALLIMYRTRKKWLPKFFLSRYKKRSDPQALEQAFKRLLKLLALFGHQKKEHQTLREYASIVDRALGINDMKAFALIYEKSRYYQAAPEQWQESKQFWENIVIKLRG